MSAAPRMSPMHLGAPALCALEWTLGKGGTLSVETVADGDSESRVIARCEIRARGVEPTRADMPLSVDGSDAGEVRLSGSGDAFLHLVSRDGGLLVLTNLPEVLGLRGGTYKLAHAARAQGR